MGRKAYIVDHESGGGARFVAWVCGDADQHALGDTPSGALRNLTDPEPEDREGLVEDARTVADFIVGWWPGLEGGINWGVPGERSGKTSEVYQAAKRLRDRLQE